MIRKTLLIFLVILSLTTFGLSQETIDKTAPKRISGGVVNGKAISLPKPVYPVEARQANAKGSVNVRVVIDEKGDVIEAEAVSGNVLLHQVSVEAAKQSKFAPTLLKDQPVKVSGIIIYNFADTDNPIETGTNNSETIKDYELEVFPLMLGTFLNAYKYVEKDDAEFDEIFMEFTSILSRVNKNLAVSGDFKQKTFQEKQKIVADYGNRVKNELTGDDVWQYRVGTAIANLLSSFDPNTQTMKQVDLVELKIRLTAISDLLFSTPESFPKEVSDKIRTLAAYADHNNLASSEVQNEIGQSLINLMQTISPD